MEFSVSVSVEVACSSSWLPCFLGPSHTSELFVRVRRPAPNWNSWRFLIARLCDTTCLNDLRIGYALATNCYDVNCFDVLTNHLRLRHKPCRTHVEPSGTVYELLRLTHKVSTCDTSWFVTNQELFWFPTNPVRFVKTYHSFLVMDHIKNNPFSEFYIRVLSAH